MTSNKNENLIFLRRADVDIYFSEQVADRRSGLKALLFHAIVCLSCSFACPACSNVPDSTSLDSGEKSAISCLWSADQRDRVKTCTVGRVMVAGM